MFVFWYLFGIIVNDCIFCRLILGVFFCIIFFNIVVKVIVKMRIFMGLIIVKDFIIEKMKEEIYFFDFVLFYFILYKIKKK